MNRPDASDVTPSRGGGVESASLEEPILPPAPAGWRDRLSSYVGSLQIDPVVTAVLLTVPTVLLGTKKFGTTWFYEQSIGWTPPGPAGPVVAHLWWYGLSALLYLALPVALARVLPPLRHEPLGFGWGDVRFGLRASALLLGVMLPVALIASQTPAFSSAYPLAPKATSGWDTFVIYEAGYALYFLAWEFLFRGFTLFPLAKRIGPAAAILVQNIPFALLHAGKPTPEAFGSVIAGVALGILALRSRSFLWGWAIHAIVACTMDLAAGWSRLP